jgi:hypothetical protein
MTEMSLMSNVEAEKEPETIQKLEYEKEQEEALKQDQQPEEEKDSPNDSEELKEVKEPATKPEVLSDNYWDEEKGEIKLDNLVKDLETEKKKALDLRKIISQKGSVKPPKEAGEYTVSEDLAELLPEDSEAMTLLREQALEAGLPKEQFATFMEGLLPAMKEQGLLVENEPELSDEEKEEEFNKYRDQELEKLGSDSKKILQRVVNWGDGLLNKGILSKDELPVFQSFANDANSLLVLNKLASLSGEPEIPVQTAIPDGVLSRKEVDELIRSEAYKKGDVETHMKVKKHFEAMNS